MSFPDLLVIVYLLFQGGVVTDHELYCIPWFIFPVIIEHGTKSLGFGADLMVAQKDATVPERPCIKSMPIEDILNQNTIFLLFSTMYLSVIQPNKNLPFHSYYAAVIWLKYCRYCVKHFAINQSIIYFSLSFSRPIAMGRRPATCANTFSRTTRPI